MKWNQEIFEKNLETLIEQKFGGVQGRFNKKFGRDSATRWKKSRPSLENLLAIADHCECSMDWLITGEHKTRHGPSSDILRRIEEIFEYYGDEEPALDLKKFIQRTYHAMKKDDSQGSSEDDEPLIKRG